MAKSISHEAEYIGLVTITLIVLSVLVFPLFIAFLPLAMIVGCGVVWRADHTPGKT